MSLSCGWSFFRIFFIYAYLMRFINEKLAEMYGTPMLWPTGALIIILTHTVFSNLSKISSRIFSPAYVVSRDICVPVNQIVWPCFLPAFTSLSPDIVVDVYSATLVFWWFLEKFVVANKYNKCEWFDFRKGCQHKLQILAETWKVLKHQKGMKNHF